MNQWKSSVPMRKKASIVPASSSCSLPCTLPVCLQQHVVKYAQGVKGDREHDDRRCQQDEQQRQGQLHPDAAADHQPERAEEEQEGK